MNIDNDTYPFAVPLSTYVIDKHNGNMAAYARELSVSPTQVKRWVDLGCMVIDGEIWRKVSKQVKQNELIVTKIDELESK